MSARSERQRAPQRERKANREVALRLELRGITKRFGDLVANDHIDLVVEPGEIHALLGENGAGKSTLMNILYGLLQPDDGEILVDGKPVRIRGPRDAIAQGIGMVHQHFMLVPVFTVTENVMLGHEQTQDGVVGVLDRRRARREVVEVSQRYGLAVDPDATIEDMPVGVQQRVEIVKALTREVDLLILDEPTAVLTPQETEELLTVMRSLKDSGKSIVFITHKLKEVQAIADQITVLRRGRSVGTALPSASEAELASMMVGRTVLLRVEKDAAAPGPAVLEVSGLAVNDDRGHRAVDGVDLTVHRGEVLGIAGVQGNGQTELVEAIMGLRPILVGSVALEGLPLAGRSTKQILGAGVGYVPEDRSVDGLIKDFTVAENLVLNLYDRPPYGSRFRLDLDKVAESAQGRIDRFDIRTSSYEAPVGHALRWQPAEGHRGTGVLPPAQALRRLAADPRGRRRVDRVHPQADHPRAGYRNRGAARDERTRRGAGPGRPDRRDVPGPDPGHRAAGHPA